MSTSTYNEIGIKAVTQGEGPDMFSDGEYCYDGYWKSHGIKGCVSVEIGKKVLHLQFRIKTKDYGAYFSPKFKDIPARKTVIWMPGDQKKIRIAFSYNNVKKVGKKLKIDVQAELQSNLPIVGWRTVHTVKETIEIQQSKGNLLAYSDLDEVLDRLPVAQEAEPVLA